MTNYKVQLIPISSLVAGSADDVRENRVVFEVTPAFSESRSVSYAQVTPVHMPGSIQMYQNTSARTFEIGAKLISRTTQDAIINRRYLQRLRGWTMPYFGTTSTLSKDNIAARTALDDAIRDINGKQLSPETRTQLANLRTAAGVELTGAPPDVLYLYAYSTTSSIESGQRLGTTSNINRVPVVITSLNISYPDDVDYIHVPEYVNYELTNAEPFPVSMSVTVTVVETHSPREYERFNLAQYKSGTLANF